MDRRHMKNIAVTTDVAASLRRQFVTQLAKAGGLTSGRVLRAFRTVPRHRFLPDVAANEGLPAVYSDSVHITAKDAKGRPTSSSSQPGLMAQMLERLDVRPGHRVLEIGAGTGYNAALLAELVGPKGVVVTIDVDPALTETAGRRLRSYPQVQVVTGDGLRGWPAGGPYDRIVVTAEPPHLPRAWHSQLSRNGLLQLPLRFEGVAAMGWVITFRRTHGGLSSVSRTPGSFMPFRDSRLRRRSQPRAAYVGAFGGTDAKAWTTRVTGSAVRALSPVGRSQLGAALYDPHTARLDASSGLLDLLENWLPTDRRVMVSARRAGRLLSGIGLIDGDGAGLAAVLFAWEQGRFTDGAGLFRWGQPGAAHRLVRRGVREWIRLGRPAAERFTYEVGFGAWPDGATWRLASDHGTFVAGRLRVD